MERTLHWPCVSTLPGLGDLGLPIHPLCKTHTTTTCTCTGTQTQISLLYNHTVTHKNTPQQTKALECKPHVLYTTTTKHATLCVLSQKSHRDKQTRTEQTHMITSSMHTNKTRHLITHTYNHPIHTLGWGAWMGRGCLFIQATPPKKTPSDYFYTPLCLNQAN